MTVASSVPLVTPRAAPRAHLRLEVLLGVGFLVLVVFAAIAAPLVTAYEPTKTSLTELTLPPMWAGGSNAHPFGTDTLGRDILTRVVYGGRISLLVGTLAVITGGSAGVTLGLLSGYYGGRMGALIMRLADVQLALPFLLLALAIMAVVGPGLGNVIAVLAIGQWVEYARVVRGEVLSLREREFIEAARVIGQRDWRIIQRHLLPNVSSTVLVIATLSVGTVILAEASLTFLGVGVGVETPSWGGMIAEGRDYMSVAGWITWIPGVALMLTILSINVVGDWLRDEFDPRLRR